MGELSWISRFGGLCAAKEGGWFCHYCAKKVQRRFGQGGIDKATIDHVIPKSRGGESKFSNFVLCCLQCNAEKADTPYLEFWQAKQEIRLRTIANRGHPRKGRKGGKLTGNRAKRGR